MISTVMIWLTAIPTKFLFHVTYTVMHITVSICKPPNSRPVPCDFLICIIEVDANTVVNLQCVYDDVQYPLLHILHIYIVFFIACFLGRQLIFLVIGLQMPECVLYPF